MTILIEYKNGGLLKGGRGDSPLGQLVHSNADKKLGQIKKLVSDAVETFDEATLFRYLFKLAIMDNKKIEETSNV